jgi:Glycosyltransferase family 87
VSSAREKAFAIYGEPILALVAFLTLTPNMVITLRERPPDFTVFFRSAMGLRQGIDPYVRALAEGAPNANPPATILPFLALTWLPERVAFWLWTAGSVIALIISLRMIARTLKMSFRPLLIAVIGLQGVAVAIRFGQVTLWLLPLMAWAWRADRDDRKDLAGACLGVLIYIKPFMALYAIYLAWRREWRMLRSLMIAGVASLAVGLLAGVSLTLSWVDTLRNLTSRAPHVVNASWLGLVSRVFTVDRPQPFPKYTAWMDAPRLAGGLWVVGLCAIALVSFWAIRRTSDRDQQWGIVGTATLLLSPLGWTYYVPLLIPPLAAVVPNSRHLGLILIAGALLWIPSNVLAAGTYGALATATVGSPYTWALLLLWAAVCLDRRDDGERDLQADLKIRTTAGAT